MTEKELVQVKHVQIYLTEPSRTNAARALFLTDLPHLKYMSWSSAEVEAACRQHGAAKVAAAMAESEARIKHANEYTGPHFHGVEQATVTEGSVIVEGSAGAMHVYPMHSVARVEVYETTHTTE